MSRSVAQHDVDEFAIDAPRAPLGTTQDLLDRYRGIISRDRFYRLKKHPDFPKPVFGGAGCKEIHNIERVDQFLANLQGGELD